jgi:hypothetical protein
MCRSIKVLRRTPPPATREEMHAAALQFIRKVSGTRKPPAIHTGAFDQAVLDVAAATERLLATMGPPRVTVRKQPQEPQNASVEQSV